MTIFFILNYFCSYSTVYCSSCSSSRFFIIISLILFPVIPDVIRLTFSWSCFSRVFFCRQNFSKSLLFWTRNILHLVENLFRLSVFFLFEYLNNEKFLSGQNVRFVLNQFHVFFLFDLFISNLFKMSASITAGSTCFVHLEM